MNTPLPALPHRSMPLAHQPKKQLLASTQNAGTATGTTQAELLTALTTGARRLLFGKLMAELNRLLPEPELPDILLVAAEARLLHGHQVVEVLANTIHHRAHLTPEARPILQLVLAELISNAIEHGNLGLTAQRSALVNETDWFEAYQTQVKLKLNSPLGRIPLLISCKRMAANLLISIEDRGTGFSIKNITESLKAETAPTGRGLSLVYALLGNAVEFSKGGRCVTFRLPVRPRTEQHPLPTGLTARQQGRIMVIDDQTITHRVAQSAFQQAGFQQLHFCQNSAAAMEEALQFKPNLILLDITMPEPDGYTLCQQFKAHPQLARTPIIFFSGHSSTTYRTKGYQLGAVDFITKPIEPAELIARSETHLLNGLMMQSLQTMQDKMTADLDRARNFQYELLPNANSLMQLAKAHNLGLATTYQGCESLAGDYWTILNLSPSHIAVCLVDFTGHGVIAALNTVQLHTLLHSETNLTNPVLMAQSLNYNLHQLLGSGSFATFIYGVLNTQTGEFAYAGGGAPAMLVRRANGTLTQLECNGLPLGLNAEIEVLPRRAQLHPGDTLLLVSDALTDSPHHNGTRWGDEGLAEKVAAMPPALNANQLLTTLLDTFYHTVQLPVPDDLTAIALTLQPEPTKPNPTNP